MNLKKLVLFYMIFLLIIIPISLAAGSGGGGSKRKLTCSEDIWSCSEWGKCQRDEMQYRKCTLVSDCLDKETGKPSEKEKCTYVSTLLSSLKCNNLGSLKERVSCRIDLGDENLEKELEINYLPEECRAISNIADREECVLLYGRSQKCWALEVGEKRNGCLKEILGITEIKNMKEACGKNNECLISARKKLYSLIKFKFYDLEERAEELYSKGKINKEKVVDIIAKLEEKKIEFNNANSKEQRKNIIKEVKTLWKNFILSI